jgi:hypothetical protein
MSVADILFRRKAVNTINTTITELEELLTAARQIKDGLERADENLIQTGMAVFANYTDHYWNALIVRPNLDAAYEFLANLKVEEES